MSANQDLLELEVDNTWGTHGAEHRVRSGFWHWKTSSGSHYKSISPYNNAPLLNDKNEVEGHLRVVPKPDAIGKLFNHYYLQPRLQTAQQMAVTAVNHDSQGTIHWQDTYGHKFVSAGSNENTCLLFDPGFQTAGTLVHSNGEYFLHQTSCSQRGSCAGGCRCNDCQNTQAHMHTDEDFETQIMSISQFTKGVADAAKKGLEAAKRGLKAVHEGVKVAHAEASKTVEALKAAHKSYKEHRNSNNSEEQGESGSQQHTQQANLHLEDARREEEKANLHLEDARREEEKAIAALNKVDTAKLSEKQQQELARAKETLQGASALVGQLVAELSHM
jgi:hypothetical protein